MTIQDLKDKNLLLLECISGSRSYGLETESSDTDIKGVFYLPKEQFYGLNYIPQINNETNDEVYYEIGRFVELLTRSNPNILELLATPDDCILFRHPLMEKLGPEMFLSKMCRETFAGYALTQIKKARGYKKKVVNPVEEERKLVLDFCYVLKDNSSIKLSDWLSENDFKQEYCGLASIPHTKGMFSLFYDLSGTLAYRGIISGPDANELSLTSVPKGQKHIAYLYFNAENYSSYCKEYREYWDWVAKRNETRYQGNRQHGKDYDAKNMMHTIRLLQVAEEIGRTGKLAVRRINRDELLAIRAGTYDYDELLVMAEELNEKIDVAYEHSQLPHEINKEKAEAILIAIRNELYK
jgi:uncharacterized protein